MRYAWIASDLMYKAGEVFDVFTINSYEFIPHLNSVDEVARRCNKPTMIGEFHFGALDRGLPSTGLRAVETSVTVDWHIGAMWSVEQPTPTCWGPIILF
jgi:hypothetical protein